MTRVEKRKQNRGVTEWGPVGLVNVDEVAAIGASIRRSRRGGRSPLGIVAELIGTYSRTTHTVEIGTDNPSLAPVAAPANAVGCILKDLTKAEPDFLTLI